MSGISIRSSLKQRAFPLPIPQIDEDHPLCAPHHEVATGVVWTLAEAIQLGLRLSGEDAVGGAEHDGHSPDGEPIPDQG